MEDHTMPNPLPGIACTLYGLQTVLCTFMINMVRNRKRRKQSGEKNLPSLLLTSAVTVGDGTAA